MCKPKPRFNAENNPQPVVDQNNNIVPNQAPAPGQAPLIVQPPQVRENQNVQAAGDDVINILRLFVNQLEAGMINQPQLERADTEKAVMMMLNHWRRKYKAEDSIESPACCVCLEPFLVDEDIIELH